METCHEYSESCAPAVCLVEYPHFVEVGFDNGIALKTIRFDYNGHPYAWSNEPHDPVEGRHVAISCKRECILCLDSRLQEFHQSEVSQQDSPERFGPSRGYGFQ